jgi:signal transduction histidine kinase
MPVLFEGDVRAVIELASFTPFGPTHMDFLDQLMESIGIVLNTIEANSRTEDLLKQSQSLANELQSQQDQLQRTNEELAEKARQLVQQNAEIEQRRDEVEAAKTLVEEKAEQLALTSRYKSEFLANMSHELRTPLNAIIGFSEILHTSPDLSEAERTEFADTIHTSGRNLLKLINDILDLTHIRAGRLELRPSPCLLAEAVDAAVSENAAAANQKELTVRSEIGRSEEVVFDPRSLRHVLQNLVNNAVKFTPPHGSVVIRSVETQPGTVVEVSDSGIGIKAEDQPRLFEEFRQVDGSTSRGYEGVGLGLALSKRLVELQGGHIWVESLPGRGSTFRFLIPRVPALVRVA